MNGSFPLRPVLPMLAVLGSALSPPSVTASDLFESPVFYQVGNLPFDVSAGNLDGDGAPDLVVANVQSEDISILFNDGTGGFFPEVRYPIGEPTRCVAVGDMNGDGHADIAVGRQQAGQTLAILYNNGEGEFSAPILVGTFAGFPDAVAILRINEDEFLDVVIGSASSGAIAVYLNNSGNGVFEERTYPTETSPAYPSDLAVGDLDADQDVDLAVAASLSSEPAKFLLNNGDGSFGESQSFTDLIASEVSVAIGDVDRNHTEDLALLDFGARSINVYSNGGPADFGPPTSYSIQTSTQPGGKVRLGDLDGDGWLDAAVAPILANPVIPVLLGDQQGGFGAAVHYRAGAGPSAILLVNVDNDTDLDIVVTNKDDDNLAILTNRSATSTAVQASAPESPSGFWLGAARPNPMGAETSIAFRLPSAGHVELCIFDVLGHRVRVLIDEERGAGLHRIVWDGKTAAGRSVPPGVYLYGIEAGAFRAGGKLGCIR